MKLYDCQMAPNPRRARVFIKQKGLDIPSEEINIIEGENLTDDYRKVNHLGLVPALQLDDGQVICEVPAICRYLEAQHPEPNLMGKDPLEAAQIEQWERFAEMTGMQAVGEVFRNTFAGFATRGLPGMTDVKAVPALVERGQQRVAAFYEELERRLGESKYLAGDRFTMADITAMCAVDFATFAEMGVPEGNKNTRKWLDACHAEPGASA